MVKTNMTYFKQVFIIIFCLTIGDRSVFFFREWMCVYVFVSTSYYESMLDCLVKMLEIF